MYMRNNNNDHLISSAFPVNLECGNYIIIYSAGGGCESGNYQPWDCLYRRQCNDYCIAATAAAAAFIKNIQINSLFAQFHLNGINFAHSDIKLFFAYEVMRLQDINYGLSFLLHSIHLYVYRPLTAWLFQCIVERRAIYMQKKGNKQKLFMQIIIVIFIFHDNYVCMNANDRWFEPSTHYSSLWHGIFRDCLQIALSHQPRPIRTHLQVDSNENHWLTALIFVAIIPDSLPKNN